MKTNTSKKIHICLQYLYIYEHYAHTPCGYANENTGIALRNDPVLIMSVVYDIHILKKLTIAVLI